LRLRGERHELPDFWRNMRGGACGRGPGATSALTAAHKLERVRPVSCGRASCAVVGSAIELQGL